MDTPTNLWIFLLIESQLKISGLLVKQLTWQNDELRKNREPHASVTAVSMITSGSQCVLACAQIDSMNVSGIFFNKDKKRCLYSSTLHRPVLSLQSSEGFVYYIPKVCEIDGYFELQTEFCVKQYENALSYVDSESYCDSEGGRLVRVDSLGKYQALKNHLIDVTVKSNMTYYVDGTKRNGNWIFSDNTTIPPAVLLWYPGEPNADNCLSLYTTMFQFGDTICSGNVHGYEFGFICERII